jgi:hypothetical protein
MPTEVLIKTGTPIVWANSADFNNTDYTRTHQINLASLATTKARQGAKADLGGIRAAQCAVRVAIECGATAPAAGTTIEFYWSSSPSATAGTANTGGASGADEAYRDGAEAAWAVQLHLIGILTLTNNGAGTVQKARIGFFTPAERYGMPVVISKAGQTLDTDGIQMYIAFIPVVDEIQNV